MSSQKLTESRRRGLAVLLDAHRHDPSGVRESNVTSDLVHGKPVLNRWGERCVYWQTLAWLRDHGYVQLRPGSASHYRLTPTGVELAHAASQQARGA